MLHDLIIFAAGAVGMAMLLATVVMSAQKTDAARRNADPAPSLDTLMSLVAVERKYSRFEKAFGTGDCEALWRLRAAIVALGVQHRDHCEREIADLERKLAAS